MEHNIVNGNIVQLNWELSNITGGAFSPTGYAYRLYYVNGSSKTLANGVTHSGGVLTWTFIPNDQWKRGHYDLWLELYQNGEHKMTLTYLEAFRLLAEGTTLGSHTAQSGEDVTINISSSCDFNRFLSVPTVGNDGKWYINGAVVKDGNGNDVYASGRGISTISKTSTSGKVDTYTITYTDNTTQTFTVTNGNDGTNGTNGTDGVGITKIEKTSTSGKVDTYTITLTNNQTYTFTVTNGNDGVDGNDGTPGAAGSSIQSIAKTSTSGLVDTYTITLTNGNTHTFTVTNGADGQGAGDMTKLIYDSANAVADAGGIVSYVASQVPAAQIQSDWGQSDNTKKDFIKNKPTIPAAQVQSDWNATTGMGVILNKPTIPAAQVQSDWNATTGMGVILNKPTIPTVPGVFSTSANGLVPAASTSGDTDKYLKGDGTWATPAGSSVTVDNVPSSSSSNPVKASGLFPIYDYLVTPNPVSFTKVTIPTTGITGITLSRSHRVNYCTASMINAEMGAASGVYSITNAMLGFTDDWVCNEIVFVFANDTGASTSTFVIDSNYGDPLGQGTSIPVYVNGQLNSTGTTVTVADSESVTIRIVRVGGINSIPESYHFDYL